jgi:hypothetical protein
MDYNPRQQRHRGEPKNHPHHLSLPVHRALCCGPSAVSYLKHFNVKFIFLWFTLNAFNRQVKFHKVDHQDNTALTKQHTAKVIELVLFWLYSLCNQIIHGGAIWNSQVNRSRLNDEVDLLGKLVPLIVEVMMDNLQAFWGEANYPVDNSPIS